MENEHMAIVALKTASANLRRLLESCQCVAEDNASDWWDPLTEQPLEAINPASISIHAQEGAARARAARELLEKAVGVAETLERSAHALKL